MKPKAYTFGVCRGAYSKVYLQANPVNITNVPGPGAYEVRSPPGKEATKYTMRPKTSGSGTMHVKVPGPGSYEFVQGTNDHGNYFVSRFMGSGATRFNPPHSKRFTEMRNFSPS